MGSIFVAPIMLYLKKDIVSSSNRFTYGKKGDKVKIFSDHDNVKIVEGHNGVRFAVNNDHLSTKKIDPDTETIQVRKKKK